MFYYRLIRRLQIIIQVSKGFPVSSINVASYCSQRKLLHNILLKHKKISVTNKMLYSNEKNETDLLLGDQKIAAALTEAVVKYDECKEIEVEKQMTSDEISFKKSRSEYFMEKFKNASDEKKAEMGLELLINSSVTHRLPINERVEFVQKVWSTLAANLILNENICEKFLKFMVNNYGLINPYFFFSDLIKNHIEVTENIALLSLECICNHGIKPEMDFIVKTMQEKELISKKVDYLLMYGNAKSGDLDGATKIFQKLESEGDESQERHAAYLKALACAGAETLLIDHYEHMQINELDLYDEDVFGIIETLLINNHTENLQEVLKWKSGYNVGKLKSFILKLISLDFNEMALSLVPDLSTFEKEDPLFVGGVMRCAVKVKMPFEDLVSMCDLLISKKASEYSLHSAARVLLRNGLAEESMKMFEIMRERGFPIRPHYFWPLVAQLTNQQKYEDAFKIVKKTKEFEVGFDEKILFYFRRLDPLQVVFKMHEVTGANINIIVQSFILMFIPESGNIKRLLNFVSTPKLSHVFRRTPTRQVAKSLATLVQGKKNIDFKNLSKVIRYFDGKISGEFLISLARLDPALVTKSSLLEWFWKERLKISSEHADNLKRFLPDETDDVIISIDRITLKNPHQHEPDKTREPTAVFLRKKIGSVRCQKYFEDLLKDAKETNRDVSFILCNLLALYVQFGEIKKAIDIRNQLLELNVPITPGIKARLFLLSMQEKDLESSLSYYEDFIKNHPDFTIGQRKIIYFASLLLENNLDDEAFTVLNFKYPKVRNEVIEKLQAQSILLLQNVARRGDSALFRKCVDVLVQKGYGKLDARLYAPLVRWFLENNEVDKAYEEFKFCVEHRKVAPYPLGLIVHFLKTEDKKKLENMLILFGRVQSEAKVNIILCFAFAELNRIKELNYYFKKYYINLWYDEKSRRHLDYYANHGLTDPLETLFFALQPSNESKLLLPYIFRSFDKNQDKDRASKFLNTLNENNIQFPKEYANLLA